MKHFKSLLPSSILASMLLFPCLGVGHAFAYAAPGAGSTAIPVIFTRTVVAGKAKSGDTVTAKTIQIVTLPGGKVIPKGTAVIGHVVESQRSPAVKTADGVSIASVLSIHFDRMQNKDLSIPITVSVRALAGPISTQDAGAAQYADETDSSGTVVLIGGDQFTPRYSEVRSPSGAVVGYNRKEGVFGRLISSSYPSGDVAFHCAGGEKEQSLALFSSDACGIYGFDTISMPANGANGDGIFTLKSQDELVKLYGGSSALLELPESAL